MRFHRVRELARPLRRQRENIVGEPDMIRAASSRLQMQHLLAPRAPANGIDNVDPNTGFAHQLQRYGHPRLDTRFSEKYPCASFHARRYASISTRSQAASGSESPDRARRCAQAAAHARAAVSREHHRTSVSRLPASASNSPRSAPSRIPPRRYSSGRSVASEPFTTRRNARLPRRRAIRKASSRFGCRHILVRKLKLSSQTATKPADSRSSAARNSSSGSAQASRRTGPPNTRAPAAKPPRSTSAAADTAASYAPASVREKMIRVGQQNLGHATQQPQHVTGSEDSRFASTFGFGGEITWLTRSFTHSSTGYL